MIIKSFIEPPIENNNYLIIDEESYQQIKKDLCKKDDYFSVEQWRKIIEKLS